ncbi:Ig-like domain-containing protein [Shewanella sp. UCD-KL12]|uniref:Ig-like domain-containing protein n=1 Tax=Shewanella sp. UCD-KL12 TaxID=1917163 RepID=UPI0009709925|nr:Ig-like domain-containing protein [Shewanella sp. UCD-KL12]
MRLIKLASTALVSLLGLSLLSGCNGSSDGGDDGGNTGEYALSLSYKTVVDGQCAEATDELSFNSNASICAVAKLTQGGSNSSGGLVSFSATLGTLSPTTKLTNSSGIAEVILANSDSTLGAGTLSAEFDTGAAENNILSVSKNYEFVDGGTPGEDTPKISASIINGAATVTQFKVDETVQLQAQFLDTSSQGIADQLVTFTAGNVTLTPNTALTNAQGIAQVNYTPSDTELGAASLNVSLDYQDQNFQTNSLYEVLSADAIGGEGVLKLGHFDSNNNFVEGVLETSLTPTDGQYVISAGGSFGVTATLINQADDGTITRVQTPSSISFSSDCVVGNNASLDTPVTTLAGQASSTFQNTSCSGNSQRNDQIVATTQSGNLTLTANLAFTLESQALASLSFESAEPKVIRIKGAGGTGSTESSLVTFKVTGSDGQPIAQQEVSFSLDTLVGGLSFSNGLATDSSFTNSAGIASVRVESGTVPTPVRVIASATDSDTGKVITSQSEQLTVNTGLPQQLGFSLSTSTLNPEAGNVNGVTETITAYASDSFGNPAPDDTTINFTAEGGQIEASCPTVNGACTVTWTSADPRVPDHRITVMAYALGHETFFDTNGNNIFDSEDGAAVDACLAGDILVACSGNGMDTEIYGPNGFSDLPDAFRDDNENGIYDEGEKYFSTTGSNVYGDRDELFNGPQCEGSLCGTGQNNKTYIRKALIMTMSGSNAGFTIWQGNNLVRDDFGLETDPVVPVTAIPAEGSSTFSVRFYDSANQIMPAGSTVAISATDGNLAFNGYTVPNANSHGGTGTSFGLSHGGTAATSQVSISLTTPSGVITTVLLGVPLS